MIELIDLGITIDKKEILTGITTSFNDGEIAGIIGAPGSGKTVLLRTVAGLTGTYRGAIKIEGRPRHGSVRKDILYMGKTMPANEDETLYNFLMISRLPYKKTFRPFSDFDIQITEEYIDLFGLAEFRNTKIGALSDSVMKRALLAFALIKDCHAVLLDNPTDDLDIGSIQLLKKALSRYVIDGNRIIVISSNDLNFIAQLSDRIIILHRGSVAEEIMPESLTAAKIKKFFGVDIMVSRNIYNGRPEIHLFPDD